MQAVVAGARACPPTQSISTAVVLQPTARDQSPGAGAPFRNPKRRSSWPKLPVKVKSSPRSGRLLVVPCAALRRALHGCCDRHAGPIGSLPSSPLGGGPGALHRGAVQSSEGCLMGTSHYSPGRGPLALGETVSNPQLLQGPTYTECRPSARNSGSPSVPPPTAAHKSQAPCAPARDQDLQCTPPSPTNKTRALGTYASSPDRFRESLGCGSRRRTSHPPSAVAPFPDKGDGFPSPGQQRSTPPSHPDEAMDPRKFMAPLAAFTMASLLFV
ncbi:hypothetical protein PCL_05341 [Purpureocillium lilacinum]|uniref:Uncharacterized protein n=1 Tax=Purpureocillium lilacinum TaxID=33203 RepID=A0A2U3DV47_PURLI|nr:hypothetical protein PCL_05341 [Purpureocillium lilacinum]